MIIPPQILGPAFLALGVVLGLALIWLIRLEMKTQKSLQGGVPRELEESVQKLQEKAKTGEEFAGGAAEYLKEVEKRLRRSAQAIEISRFDAFPGNGTGGNQSFAVCFLNESGDGAIITNIVAREKNNIFVKPLLNFKCMNELSPEEEEIIRKAKEKLEK